MPRVGSAEVPDQPHAYGEIGSEGLSRHEDRGLQAFRYACPPRGLKQN
jgi:hypothetical protein